jgi:hypothetical protein
MESAGSIREALVLHHHYNSLNPTKPANAQSKVNHISPLKTKSKSVQGTFAKTHRADLNNMVHVGFLHDLKPKHGGYKDDLRASKL